MSKELEAFRRIDISLSDYLGEGLINERKMISQALTELEELKRDVKRYFELWLKWSIFEEMTDHNKWEYAQLKGKLLKVGNEDV